MTMRTFFTACALLLAGAAAPAEAVTLGLEPVASPRLQVEADGFLEAGFLFLSGVVTAQPAGLELNDWQLSGFLGDDATLLIFGASSAVEPEIEARLGATGFAPGRLEFLFPQVLAGRELLGSRLLLVVTGAAFDGDPFAGGFDVVGGSGVIAAPVPLPATALLLLGGLGVLASTVRRRAQPILA
jgi:hypothetical protein